MCESYDDDDYYEASRKTAGYEDEYLDDDTEYIPTPLDEANEGVTKCFCGCKYWENGICIDCGTSVTKIPGYNPAYIPAYVTATRKIANNDKDVYVQTDKGEYKHKSDAAAEMYGRGSRQHDQAIAKWGEGNVKSASRKTATPMPTCKRCGWAQAARDITNADKDSDYCFGCQSKIMRENEENELYHGTASRRKTAEWDNSFVWDWECLDCGETGRSNEEIYECPMCGYDDIVQSMNPSYTQASRRKTANNSNLCGNCAAESYSGLEWHWGAGESCSECGNMIGSEDPSFVSTARHGSKRKQAADGFDPYEGQDAEYGIATCGHEDLFGYFAGTPCRKCVDKARKSVTGR
jgi:hypothetical protein